MFGESGPGQYAGEPVPQSAVETTHIVHLSHPAADLGADIYEHEDVGEGTDVVVDSVDPAGPAALAGLGPGMVVLSVNGDGIYDGDDFTAAIARARRRTRPRMVIVTAPLDPGEQAAQAARRQQQGAPQTLTLHLQHADENIGVGFEWRGHDPEHGGEVVITGAHAGGAWQRSGLPIGLALRSFGGLGIHTSNDLRNAIMQMRQQGQTAIPLILVQPDPTIAPLQDYDDSYYSGSSYSYGYSAPDTEELMRRRNVRRVERERAKLRGEERGKEMRDLEQQLMETRLELKRRQEMLNAARAERDHFIAKEHRQRMRDEQMTQKLERRKVRERTRNPEKRFQKTLGRLWMVNFCDERDLQRRRTGGRRGGGPLSGFTDASARGGRDPLAATLQRHIDDADHRRAAVL